MRLFNIFKKANDNTNNTVLKDKKLEKSLNKTSSKLLIGFNNIAKKSDIDDAAFEELEELLITSDISVNTTLKIVNSLRKEKIKNIEDLKTKIKDRIFNIINIDNSLVISQNSPYIILLVGVNGVGKTTSIAKLTKLFLNNENTVAIAACDTFRAAAIEQLQIWANRLNVHLIKHQHGSDPSAVLYDAINYCKARNIDILIADTAGRIHSKVNLMNELKKLVNTSKKLVNDAPHEVLLVLDANMGQNALNQALAFKNEVGVSGIIITKLDGSAKGGIIVSIIDELKIPVKFIGIGESVEDIAVFEPQSYVDNIIK
jgi:fused signal recognition particle receptor